MANKQYLEGIDLCEDTEEFTVLDEEECTKLEYNDEWVPLGEFYIDYGKWVLYTNKAHYWEPEECDKLDYLWLEGVCFEFPRDSDVDYYDVRRNQDDVLIRVYFVREPKQS